jgi:hypothetical protein
VGTNNTILFLTPVLIIKQTHLLVGTNTIRLLSLFIITIMPCCGNKDTCDCAGCCRYPNGPIQVILAQLLLFMGAIFSIESMVDCRFVDATIENIIEDRHVPLPEDLESYLPTDKPRGLGFFFWELENGECSWDLEEDFTESLYNDYVDFLGGDWRAPRGMGTTASSLSVAIWIWVLVFTCVAHQRPVRYLVSALCFLILVVFQSVTFAVITSDFCDDADCDLGRGAGFSIAAVLCFSFSGLLFLVMRDHPGNAEPAVAAAPAATAKGAVTHEEADPTDMEEQTVEHVEDDHPTEQVLNDGIADAQEIEPSSSDLFVDAQEIEAPSEPFADSTDDLIKAVPE